jgi:hypothetical protein
VDQDSYGHSKALSFVLVSSIKGISRPLQEAQLLLEMAIEISPTEAPLPIHCSVCPPAV